MPGFLKEFFNRNGVGMGSIMLGLVLFWTIGLIILPQLSACWISRSGPICRRLNMAGPRTCIRWKTTAI